MPEVICDTSPLQYLFQTGLLHLLPKLYGRILIANAVVEELAVGRAQGVALPDPTLLSWIAIRMPLDKNILTLVTDLGQGERETLALATETADPLLLLDDALARKHAALLKFSFTGTLGVLLKAKKSGLLLKLTPVIEKLDALRFRLDPVTKVAVLKLAGEIT